MLTAEVITYPQNFMALHGERLVDLGYRVIPIMPGSKAPGSYRGSKWSGYTGWTTHCGRPTRTFEISIWRGWPGCGVGVACGNVVALDIDVTDTTVALEIEAAARAELGDTPAVRVGRAPKRLLVYRSKGTIKPIKRHPLEIIAQGNQFVAYAIHPVTQKPYEWINEQLDEIMIERLPAITQDQCARFLEKAERMVPPELCQRRLKEPRSWEKFPSSDPFGTVEGVAAALPWIPNDDLSYDDWVYIGMALKGALPDDGLPIWRDWSAQSAKNDPKTTDKSWKSFKPTNIGVGTIYRFAMDAGWVPPANIEMSGTRADLAAGVDVSAFVEAIQDPAPEPSPTPPPPAADFVSAAPGLLGDITRWIVGSAVSPQPLLALGGAMAFVGALAGQRWRLDAPDTRSNIYIATLAGSGSGKEHPRSMLKKLAAAADLRGYLSEEIGSSAGLMTQVWRHNCRVYMIDELGHFIGSVTAKNTAGHRTDILPKLTMLWSSSHTYMQGRELAELKNEDAIRLDIDQPCVCVYGSTVPSTWWQALAGHHVADGSLARWMVFPVERDYPDQQVDLPDPEAGMPALVAACHRLITGAECPDALQLASAIGCVQQPPGKRGTNGAMVLAQKPTPAPRIVSVSPLGKALLADFAQASMALKREHEGRPTAAVAARWYEHIRRVGLIAAVASDSLSPMLDVHHLEWARAVVDRSTTEMLIGVAEYVADTAYEADVKKVLRLIGYQWISTKSVFDRTRWLKRRDRDEILIQLVESGKLETKKEHWVRGSMGRPPTLYRRKR